MLTYFYKAVTENGEMVSGETRAEDHSMAVSQIQDLGYMPLQVQETPFVTAHGGKMAGAIFNRRKKRFPVISFTRDLATLLQAGVPLENALLMLIDLAETETSKGSLEQLWEQVRSGQPLSEAMSKHPAIFSRFYTNMVRAGEEGGALEAVLQRLSGFLQQYDELKQSVKTALIYPAILLFVTLFSLMILMTLVVPQFQALFEDMGQELPWITQVVIAAGEVVSQGWWLAVLLVIAVVAWFRKRLQNAEYRLAWDARLLRLPLLGELLVRIQVAIFSRTLSTLLGSGVSLLDSLRIARDTLSNQAIARAVGAVAESVRSGDFLAASMGRHGVFPGLLIHLVRVGEESGKLESALGQLADIYDREVGVAIKRLLALLEPVLIIGLGVLIGGIIASILVAVLSVNDLAL